MPKKKNFLGGQQNYNPNNGQYEPALKGPNGESPSQFSSFKKAESKDKNESFDAINKKRMGKEPKLTGSDLVDEFQDRLQSLSNDYNVGLQDDESTIGELKKIKADLESKKNLLDEEQYKSLSEEIDRQIGAGSNDEVTNDETDAGDLSKEEIVKAMKEWYMPNYFDKNTKDYTKLTDDEIYDAYLGELEQYGDELNEELRKNLKKDEDALKILKWGGNFTDDEWEKVKANENWVKGYLEGKYTPKEIKNALKAESENNSFDQINAKRIGKEQPKSEETTKSHKSADRKDKYGNPLVSDDAFKVGQKAAKEYLEESLKYNDLDSLKKSNVFLGYMQDKISNALEQAGLNPDYDLTYQDLNEIIGSVIGEEIDFEDYEGNATKGWTGKKYSGYKPSETENHKYNSLDEVIKEWNSVLDSATKMSNDEFMAKYDELRKEFDRLGGNKKK